MERWGLGYEGIAALNPKAVVLSSSFQGQEGPDAAQPGYASLLHALCGINQINGWPDLPPTDIADAYGDLIGVWYGLAGASWPQFDAAGATGHGSSSTVAVRRGGQLRVPDHPRLSRERPKRRPQGNARWRRPRTASTPAPPTPPPARGRRPLVRHRAYTDEQWRALVEVMGRPDWPKKPGSRPGRRTPVERRPRRRVDRGVDRFPQGRGRDASAARGAGVRRRWQRRRTTLCRIRKLTRPRALRPVGPPGDGPPSYDAPSFQPFAGRPHELRRAPLLGEHTHFVATEAAPATPTKSLLPCLAAGVFRTGVLARRGGQRRRHEPQPMSRRARSGYAACAGLGAGTMGAQIAALAAASTFPSISCDRPARKTGTPPPRPGKRRLLELSPSPLYRRSRLRPRSGRGHRGPPDGSARGGTGSSRRSPGAHRM